MTICPNCSRIKKNAHPDKNLCICGETFDGSGKVILKCSASNAIIVSEKEKLLSQNPCLSSNKSYRNKPGSALESLIPEWAVESGRQCSCASMKAQMDTMGTQWCIDQSDMLVEHLMQQSDKLIPIFRVLPYSLRMTAAKNLLEKAITMSQK
jgi:hypothetical protein